MVLKFIDKLFQILIKVLKSAENLLISNEKENSPNSLEVYLHSALRTKSLLHLSMRDEIRAAVTN